MPGEQTEEKSLQVIIGEQLSAVAFVQDYVQFSNSRRSINPSKHATFPPGLS
jgi:hypothetical protein